MMEQGSNVQSYSGIIQCARTAWASREYYGACNANSNFVSTTRARSYGAGYQKRFIGA